MTRASSAAFWASRRSSASQALIAAACSAAPYRPRLPPRFKSAARAGSERSKSSSAAAQISPNYAPPRFSRPAQTAA